jgi:hypothetical protein
MRNLFDEDFFTSTFLTFVFHFLFCYAVTVKDAVAATTGGLEEP